MVMEATDILAEHAAMETRRFNFEALWQEVATLMLPRQADFLMSGTAFAGLNQGAQRTDNIIDETAMLGLDHGSAVFEGEVIPQGVTWQRLKAHNPELMKLRHVAEFYERLTIRLFALRNHPKSGFANQTHESVCSLLSFGLQGMTTDKLTDARGAPMGLRYMSEHVGQLYIREDGTGAVETTHKKFRWTHRKALQKWGEKAPECALKAETDVNPAKLDEEATYLHVVTPQPRSIYDPERIDYRGKPILSLYLCVEDRQVFDVGGFRARPLTVSRYEKSPMEDYGRCPAINVLPAIRMAQVVKQSLVTAIEFIARPALAAHDDMIDQLIMYAPGGVSYGAIDDRGNKTVQQLLENPDISAAASLLAETQKVIQRAFFEDLYIARQELKSHISASEQLIRDAQRGILLAPLKRQENEWLTPQVDRELDLMNEMGMLDDMPMEVREEGGLFQTEYDNPLGVARRASEASAFYNVLSGVAPLMQLDPSTVKQFFREYPFERVLNGLGDIHGVSVAFRATDEEKAAFDADAQALAQKATLLDVGERAAGIAKDLAGAAPQQLPAPASGAAA
jgi:hypothetical protein